MVEPIILSGKKFNILLKEIFFLTCYINVHVSL